MSSMYAVCSTNGVLLGSNEGVRVHGCRWERPTTCPPRLCVGLAMTGRAMCGAWAACCMSWHAFTRHSRYEVQLQGTQALHSCFQYLGQGA